uniref:Uncharacterized protein n=1 Tax=Anguilla anguilla TaxID=7936 RepID=A0A0E9WZE7_ANGAN
MIYSPKLLYLINIKSNLKSKLLFANISDIITGISLVWISRPELLIDNSSP